jgi:hypothetical protein
MAAGKNDQDLTYFNWVWLLPAGMLLLAVLPLPYGYYTLLRLVVCLASLIHAAFGWQYLKPVAFISGFLAILFNPLIPIHLDKEVWLVIDIAAAIYQFIVWRLLLPKYKNPPLPKEVQAIFEQITQNVFGKSSHEMTDSDFLAFSAFWVKERDFIDFDNTTADELRRLFNEFKIKYADAIAQFARKN